MTTIHHSKVNLVEKDIEDWLWANPDEIAALIYAATDFQWVARQYKVPSGIIDLLGIVSTKMGSELGEYLVLAEVKHQPITSAAVAQICRYWADVSKIHDEIFTSITGEPQMGEPWIYRLLIGPDPVDNQVLFEAEATGVRIHTYSVELNLDLHGRTYWTNEARERHSSMISGIANSPEMEPIRQMIANTIKTKDGGALPFTEENGDCSFAENGDLL